MAAATLRGAILAGLMVVIGLLGACGVDQVRSVPLSPEPVAALGPTTTLPPARSPTALKPPGLARGPAAAPEAERRIVERVPAREPRAGTGPSPAARPPAACDITLRFDETDIREVAAVILRDLLKVNYLIDPEVTGTVTLSTGRPLTRDQLLPTLEALLSTRGAALIESAGIYRVTLLRDGVRPGQVPRPRLSGARPEPGQAIEVFALDHIAAPEMAKILEPVLPRGRIVAADATRGLLMVAGNSQELEAARETVRIFDLDQMAGTSVLLITLQNAEAAQLVPELENIFSAGAKGAEPGPLRFLAIERMNGILVIARARRALDDAQAWIVRLDRTRRAGEPQLYVYYVQHGKAVEVAKTLQGVFGAEGGEGEGVAGPSPAGAAAGLTAPSAFNLPQEGPPPGDTAVAESPRSAPAPAMPPRLEVALPQARSARGAIRIRADEATNALLIQATPHDYERVHQVLQQIDILPLQVLIEANIIEVMLSNQLRYGLQYFLNTGGLGLSAQGRIILTRDTTQANQITPPIPGFSFSFLNSAGSPQAIIDLLSDLTQVSVLSTPQLLVLDNQVARLQVGDQVPIQTQSLQSFNTGTSNPQILNAIQYRDTGVTLEVTPRVNAGGTVVLDINQSVSQVVATTSSTINSPTFRQRRLVSSVAAQSGNTILLGGLIREDTDRGDSGIPLLHELPLIGALFGGKRDLITRTELVVMLTPRVVRNAEEARDLTQEMRRRYQAVLTYQHERPRPPGPAR